MIFLLYEALLHMHTTSIRLTHQFITFLRVAVNLRLEVQKRKDSVSRNSGLGIVWSKGSRLSYIQSPKHKGNEDTEDVTEILMGNVARVSGDLERSETEHNSTHEEESTLRKAVGYSIDKAI